MLCCLCFAFCSLFKKAKLSGRAAGRSSKQSSPAARPHTAAAAVKKKIQLTGRAAGRSLIVPIIVYCCSHYFVFCDTCKTYNRPRGRFVAHFIVPITLYCCSHYFVFCDNIWYRVHRTCMYEMQEEKGACYGGGRYELILSIWNVW